MDSAERLRRCYFHEELDRPGVYVRSGYPKGDASYDRVRAYVQAHTELKNSWPAAQLEQSPPIDEYTENHSQDWQRRVRVLHTPRGDLRTTTLLSLRGLPGMAEEHFLKTRQDAETYLSLPMPRLAGDASGFGQAARAMGRRGITEVSLGTNPAGKAAGLFGSETFALMTVMDRDLVHALCQREMERLLVLLKHVLSLGAGPYFSMAGEEFVVPPLHGPRDFEDFNARYDRPIIDAIHEAGGRIHIHCHGSLKKVFGSFVDMGVDVLHPVEPPPMGDLTAAEAKRLARGRLTIEGNIQIAAMYEHTSDRIRQETLQLIGDAFDDGRGLIVCPSASPYQRGKGEQCFENFKAMIDTVTSWKP